MSRGPVHREAAHTFVERSSSRYAQLVDLGPCTGRAPKTPCAVQTVFAMNWLSPPSVETVPEVEIITPVDLSPRSRTAALDLGPMKEIAAPRPERRKIDFE